MNKKVSIIVPVYNQERFLKDCVYSITMQSYKNIEIILIDDGSTNQAGNECDVLSREDNRIKVIHQNRMGVSEARLAGLKHSSGDWVMLIDSDDVISRDMIKILVENITSDDIDVVIGKYVEVKEDFILREVERIQRGQPFLCSGMQSFDILLKSKGDVPAQLWGKIYKKSFLEKVNIEQYRKDCPIVFFEDILLTPILLYNAQKCIFVNDVLYYYRKAEFSLSRQVGIPGPWFYDQIISCDILLSFLKDKNIEAYYYSRLPGALSLMIRLFCTTNNSVSHEQELLYKRRIIVNERKYAMDYLLHSNDKLWKKMCILSFIICPAVFSIVGKYYFDGTK